MTPEKYIDLKQFVIDSGFGNEIDWSENLSECNDALNFFEEAAWVIINSGIKNQVARKIWDRIIEAMLEGSSVHSAFGHKGKADAIEFIWANRKKLLDEYLLKDNDDDKIAFLETIPWIGKITKYHLAKNLGMDICKPDRHLVRIAEKYNTTPEELCKKLSDAIGDRIATVDYIIWRAANLGKI